MMEDAWRLQLETLVKYSRVGVPGRSMTANRGKRHGPGGPSLVGQPDGPLRLLARQSRSVVVDQSP